MSKAITEKKDDKLTLAPSGGPGPSVQIEDEPSIARFAALVGAFCAVVGGVALYMGLFTARVLPWPFTPPWASLILHFGVLCLLFHSAYDNNVEFRRVYQVLGLGCILLGGVFCFLPYRGETGRPGRRPARRRRAAPGRGFALPPVHPAQRNGRRHPRLDADSPVGRGRDSGGDRPVLRQPVAELPDSGWFGAGAGRPGFPHCVRRDARGCATSPPMRPAWASVWSARWFSSSRWRGRRRGSGSWPS